MHGHLEVYAADQASTVTVDGQAQPLEPDLTAALASTLDKSLLHAIEIAALLRGGTIARQLPRPHPGRPVHVAAVPARRDPRGAGARDGLQSRALGRADQRARGGSADREQFQIWFFLYDTGNPIGYSAGRLRAALTATVQQLDPEGQDPALRRMVVIGHSQGGLLTKMTAIDSGTQFWDHISSKPFEEIQISPETRAFLQQSVFFTPLPFVERVVFVATPHHGAIQAGQLGALAARLITMPVAVFGGLAEAVASTGDAELIATLRRPPTAIDNMSPTPASAS